MAGTLRRQLIFFFWGGRDKDLEEDQNKVSDVCSSKDGTVCAELCRTGPGLEHLVKDAAALMHFQTQPALHILETVSPMGAVI